MRVGYFLDFNSGFGEAAGSSERSGLLQYLDQHTHELPGFVDLRTARIYRISRGSLGNWISPIVTVLLVVLGALSPDCSGEPAKHPAAGGVADSADGGTTRLEL